MQLGWLLTREVVISLAILGALLAMAGSALEDRIGKRRAFLLNRAGYTLTGASILIFIVVGFSGSY